MENDDDAFWYQNDANPATFAKNVQQQVLSKLPGGGQQQVQLKRA